MVKQATSIELFEFNRNQSKKEWKPPKAYKRDKGGRTVLYYLMKAHIDHTDANKKGSTQHKRTDDALDDHERHRLKHTKSSSNGNLINLSKDFKRRREWLIVFIKYITQNRPNEENAEYDDWLEWRRTARNLGVDDEDVLDDEAVWDRYSSRTLGNRQRTFTNQMRTMFRAQSDLQTHDGDQEVARKHHKTQSLHAVPSSANDGNTAIVPMSTDDWNLSNMNANPLKLDLEKEPDALQQQFSESAVEPEPTAIDMKSLSAMGINHLLSVDSQSADMRRSAASAAAQNQRIFVNMADNKGRTALHWATKLNSIDFLNLFLELGADPNMVDQDGESAMHSAVRLDRYDILDAFIIWTNKVKEQETTKDDEIEPVGCNWSLRDGAGLDVVFACINYGRTSFLSDLYHGAAVNVQRVQQQKNTILQWAVKLGDAQSVQTILDLDALSVDWLTNKNMEQKGALEMAVLAQNGQIIESLLDHFVMKMEDGDDQKLYKEMMHCLEKAVDLKFANVLRVIFERAKDVILMDAPRCHEILEKVIRESVDTAMLEVFCVFFPECLTLQNANGETMPFYCVKLDKQKLLKLLMNKFECDPTVVNQDGYDLLKYCDRFDRPTCRHTIQQKRSR